MAEYKSRKLVFFKKRKIISLGTRVTPSVVKLFTKLFGNQIAVGRSIEYVIVIFIVLSIVIYII